MSQVPGLISHEFPLKSFCKSQIPHKFVKVSFNVNNVKSKLPDFVGIDSCKTSAGGRRGRASRSVVVIEFFIDNLLARIHFIIEMISVDRPFAMGS